MLLSTFRLTRSAALVFLAVNLLLGAAWARKETVLHTFCTEGEPCTDGAQPYAGLVFGPNGYLYGTTGSGGKYYGGIVFKATASGTETVLYDFCSQDNCTDGQFPYAGLVFDAEGNAYGTTSWGGDSSCNLPYGCGVVFKLTPSGTETVLHTFTGTPDGQFPMAGLIFDESGNLYGTTYEGGISGSGAVFKVTPSGEETILYSFGSQCYCPELYYPYAGLVLDKKGNLYGTTRYGAFSSSSAITVVARSLRWIRRARRRCCTPFVIRRWNAAWTGLNPSLDLSPIKRETFMAQPPKVLTAPVPSSR